ncbi:MULTISPECIES: LacI family DNA-binding transcriptional regulator [Caulobacter]|jgi:LacI family transcriptional regulator|uniref:Transcriptional regulator, LacI family n=1 Tax=Caulobacter vibrioides OR37 TaxID=1292034 RepID=R0CYM2_CAUVI|nr:MULTISPECIES: LacI family DNA-binding transcriptional regulator [Caulobacter]ENZ81385.1 transcriptional regulator, LacI family [Caulobacter vibrioides OR37]MBQ1560608.1 LacI family DNA-binding transcriptional regulator [Caulobacter sp.]
MRNEDPPVSTSVTIVDIARQAGVSIKTVSRVINREEGVGAETRARVQAIIDRLRYRPNASARSLSSRRSYLIGVIFLEVGAYYYVGQVQVGAMRACRRAGYHLVVEQVRTPGAMGGVQAFAQSLREARFDGVVLTPPTCDDPEVLAAIETAGLPYVRIAPDRDFDRSPYVFMDDRAAAREQTLRLWDMGHRRIAFIDGPADHGSAARRRQGYVEALRERGAEPRPEWIVQGAFRSLSGFEAAEGLLGLPEPPTAIFAANDEMAMGVLAAAAKHGLSLPGDLSVVGFDDTPAAEAAWPRLTTIHQPTAEMAEAAVDILIDGFGDERFRGRTAIRQLDYTPMIRDSAAPPRR